MAPELGADHRDDLAPDSGAASWTDFAPRSAFTERADACRRAPSWRRSRACPALSVTIAPIGSSSTNVSKPLVHQVALVLGGVVAALGPRSRPGCRRRVVDAFGSVPSSDLLLRRSARRARAPNSPSPSAFRRVGSPIATSSGSPRPSPSVRSLLGSSLPPESVWMATSIPSPSLSVASGSVPSRRSSPSFDLVPVGVGRSRVGARPALVAVGDAVAVAIARPARRGPPPSLAQSLAVEDLAHQAIEVPGNRGAERWSSTPRR